MTEPSSLILEESLVGIEGETWLKQGIIDSTVEIRLEAELEDVDSVVRNVGIEVGRMGSLQSAEEKSLIQGHLNMPSMGDTLI